MGQAPCHEHRDIFSVTTVTSLLHTLPKAQVRALVGSLALTGVAAAAAFHAMEAAGLVSGAAPTSGETFRTAWRMLAAPLPTRQQDQPGIPETDKLQRS